MKKFLILLLIPVLYTGLQSCKKQETEDNSDNNQPDPLEIITKDYWLRVKVETYNSSGTLTHVNNPYDKWIFALSKDYYVFDTSGQLDRNGKWELLDDGNIIDISDRVFNVDTLSEDLFIISEQYYNYGDKQIHYYVRN